MIIHHDPYSLVGSVYPWVKCVKSNSIKVNDLFHTKEDIIRSVPVFNFLAVPFMKLDFISGLYYKVKGSFKVLRKGNKHAKMIG